MNDAASGELPEGWALARLTDVAEVNPPKPAADALSADAPVSFVPMPAVNADTGAIDGAAEPFADGDVLLAKITPCFENGKAAVAAGLRNGLGFGSSEFHVLRSRGAVLPAYLHHFVRQPRFREVGAENMTGTAGQARVPVEFVREVALPLPPLAEQRRIVDAVDALLAQVGSARKRLAAARGIVARFRQAVLAAACSGRLTEEWRDKDATTEPASELLRHIASERARMNLASGGQRIDPDAADIPDAELPTTWAWCRVGEVANVCLGGTPSRKEPRFWDGIIPWVSSGEVANRRISRTAERITDVGLGNSNAKVYPQGSVLIAMIGEGKTRGQSAILDIPAATNQNVAALVFDAGHVDPEYIWYWALGEYERNRDVGRGGNQAALNGRIVRALALPLPPLVEQHEIVRCVRGLLASADAVDRRLTTALAHADRLPQAVLTRAFGGQLVPTEAELARAEGRAYEPADALLRRMATHRPSGAPNRRVRTSPAASVT